MASNTFEGKSFHPASLLLGTDSEEVLMCGHKDAWAKKFTAATFENSKTWKERNYPSTIEWINSDLLMQWNTSSMKIVYRPINL